MRLTRAHIERIKVFDSSIFHDDPTFPKDDWHEQLCDLALDRGALLAQAIELCERQIVQDEARGRLQARSILTRTIKTLRALLATTLGLSCLLLGLPEVRAADDWSVTSTVLQLGYTAALALDCAQTRYEISHPGRTREGNALIGPYPSKGKINAICLTTGLGHWGISYALPSKLRTDWQAASIFVELMMVRNNYMLGTKVEF